MTARTVALALAASSVALLALGCATTGSLPSPPPPRAADDASSDEEASIQQREICVGSSVVSAGTLGDTLYYRAASLADGTLVVGYFAFFSEERPWGNNWLTWTVVPALLVDMVYSHGLVVGPGVQRLASGKGDVEGFRIVYQPRSDGTLDVVEAFADDGSHRPVHLSRADVLAIDGSRPTLYSDTWSHQLGGRGARSTADLSYVQCYDRAHIHPLPERIDREYALAGRAGPAHVETLGGDAHARALGQGRPMARATRSTTAPHPPAATSSITTPQPLGSDSSDRAGHGFH